MPDPIMVPNLYGSSLLRSNPESMIASSAAFSENCTNLGIFLKSLTDKKAGGTKSITSPAICELYSLASN